MTDSKIMSVKEIKEWDIHSNLTLDERLNLKLTALAFARIIKVTQDYLKDSCGGSCEYSGPRAEGLRKDLDGLLAALPKNALDGVDDEVELAKAHLEFQKGFQDAFNSGVKAAVKVAKEHLRRFDRADLVGESATFEYDTDLEYALQALLKK